MPAADTGNSKIEMRNSVMTRTHSPGSEKQRKRILKKKKERTRHVYENKGSAFHRPRRSENVIENKATYPLMPGILLKIHDL